MRILITNNTLAHRAGSELYVRDVALGLLARGHSPIAFSTVLGEVAQELRAATIPVIDDLGALSVAPDIIHGQHHLETMTALLRFPKAPAVYFCHGWGPWEEAPPRFPRVLRYVAVDHTCRDRLVFENAIPENRVRVLFNFVDLDRFKPRGPLPSRPQRALVFSNYAAEDTHLKQVRQACQEVGLGLDVVGLGAGNACSEPERILGDYDLVFAKGRSALEALAVGAAVVLCDSAGAGPLVTTRELDRLRSLNFGLRVLRAPVSTEALAAEIGRYDADDAARVARRIRATAGREAVIDEIVALYQEVIAEFESMEGDAVAEQRAAAEYLRWLSPRVKECQRVIAEGHRIQREVDAVRAQLGEFQQKAQEWEEKERGLAAEVASREAQLSSVTSTLGWRLLSHYGPIRQGLVLPIYQTLQRILTRRGS